MKSPGEYEAERRRFVQAGVDALKRKLTNTGPVDKMMHDLQGVIDQVLALAKPIQQAGGAVKPSDELAMRTHVFEWTLQRFEKWDSNALRMLCTTLIAERLMQEINSDPWGTGTKDLLT